MHSGMQDGSGFKIHKKYILFGKKQVKFASGLSRGRVVSRSFLNEPSSIASPQTREIKKSSTQTSFSQPTNLNSSTDVKKVAVTERSQEQKKSSEEENHLSDATDDTDVLCSENIIEKAFSYAEKDGVNAIHDWIPFCSFRKNKGSSSHVTSQSAPASYRSPPLTRCGLFKTFALIV